MPLKTSFPQCLTLYCSNDNKISIGDISAERALDVYRINVLVYLNGDFENKNFTMTLTEGARVYVSKITKIDFNGRALGYLTFDFEKFHSKIADVFQAEIAINDSTGVEFCAVADFEPEVNVDQVSQRRQAPRFEFYGV